MSQQVKIRDDCFRPQHGILDQIRNVLDVSQISGYEGCVHTCYEEAPKPELVVSGKSLTRCANSQVTLVCRL